MLDPHESDLPTVSELFQAYYDCRLTKRNSASALLFEERLERNLMDLYYALIAGEYHPGRSTVFVVEHPKVREVLHARHSAMRALAGDAGVAVVDEAPVEALGHPVVEQVMHDAVTKLSRPDLAHLRVFDHETHTRAWPVLTGHQLVVHIHQIALQALLKRQGAGAVALRRPA